MGIWDTKMYQESLVETYKLTQFQMITIIIMIIFIIRLMIMVIIVIIIRMIMIIKHEKLMVSSDSDRVPKC